MEAKKVMLVKNLSSTLDTLLAYMKAHNPSLDLEISNTASHLKLIFNSYVATVFTFYQTCIDFPGFNSIIN
jgi:hypothetical protein